LHLCKNAFDKEVTKWKELEDAKEVLKEILINVKKAYIEAGIVHADLSDYNIIVQPDMRVLIIDWPQYVTRQHPNTEDLLNRDLKNVLDFFSRKYKLKVEIEKARDFVVGNTEKLQI